MNGETATEIRFFSLTSRIGRLRYIAYGMGLTLLAIVPFTLAMILWMMSPGIGWPVFAIMEIALLVMTIGFMVRRLHDMDRSGWWSLLVIVPLANLILWLFLVFARGSDGENSYGPPPPPNSTWVIVGAWSLLLIPFLGGILAAIAIPAYQDFVARSQMVEALQIAGAAEKPVAEGYQRDKVWPEDLTRFYNNSESAGKYVDTLAPAKSESGAFGIVATMKSEGVNFNIAGKAMEVWTDDGGNTWHCGPASVNPVEARYLIGSCRETQPSPP
jgi:uncharacterized membrane protein YhaH (DUF805 family)/Tfp pilus assembly protein PilE